MIKVTVTKEQSDRIHSFEMSGHAQFAEYGKDLVCAAASAVSFGALNAVMTLTNSKPNIKQGSDGGYLKAVFSKDEIENHDIQLILNTMIVSLQTIEQDYGEHIKIIFKK